MSGRWRKVVVEAPAKLNLALDVTGIVEDGYHTVDMVMQAVDVWERVELTRSKGYSLRLPGSSIPAGEKNTATKAAAAFFYATGLLAGADIIVHKAVPTRAGLAGGSADAAAVLTGLNELYGAGLSLRELCAIGAGVGADVPFSLMGGTARAEGMGEQLTPLTPLAGCWFCIAMPCGMGVSTPAAYARYDVLGSPVRPNVAAACSAIEAEDLNALASHMQNALEYANCTGPGARVLEMLRRAGAEAALMTGSGAAVFGLFKHEKTARTAAQTITPHAACVFVARPVREGPKIVAKC